MKQSFRRLRRSLVALAAVALASLVPMSVSSADIVVPDPVGPYGYTFGYNNLGSGQTCSFYKVALGNGVAVELGTDLPCVDGLTFSASGVLYGYRIPPAKGPVFQSTLVTVNIANGAQTAVGPMGRGFFEGGMTFDKDGKLWLYAQPTDTSCNDLSSYNCLYSVDPATGTSTVVGGSGSVRGFTATGLAANCTTVYATGTIAAGEITDSLWTVDTTTGAVTKVGNTGLPVFTEGLDFAADGTLYTIGEPFTNGPVPYAPMTATLDPASGAGSNAQHWVSNDTTPNVVMGLAVAGLSCPQPQPQPPPEVQPTFTG